MDEVQRESNIIRVSGNLRDSHYLLSQLHQCIEDRGYSDVIIDMSKCTAAFQHSMLAVCAQTIAYREAGVDISLTLPEDNGLKKLFHNTNWAHYLDPRRFDVSTFRGYIRIPATRYTNAVEQQNAVNRIVNTILGALKDIQRSNLASFEWSINEITDNVLWHSRSPVGGLVQVSTFQKNTQSIEFVVADAGVGIPTTLKEVEDDIRTDTEALENAIKEGVTRDKNKGQGNGLFGTYQVCSKSGGTFQIDSGYARLRLSKSSKLSISDQRIPYPGTLVIARMDFSNPELLRDALQFKGVTHKPTDYVETQYEGYQGTPRIVLIEECHSFGSRVSGGPLQRKLLNIVRMMESDQLTVDLRGIPIVSSSFADEVFGKLFLELGPVQFMQRIKLVNMEQTVEALINKAIAQRMQHGANDIKS